MDREYFYRDIIERLGVRYYVLRELKDSYWCISGYSFEICYVPKGKLTKHVGKSKLALSNCRGLEDD